MLHAICLYTRRVITSVSEVEQVCIPGNFERRQVCIREAQGLQENERKEK